MRAKTLTGRTAPTPPGPRRWDGWARALAGRFRADRPRRPRRPETELVLHRPGAGQGTSLVERIFERTLVMRTALFAPRLHLTVAPLLRLGGPGAARSLPPSSGALPGVTAAGGAARFEERLALARHAAPKMEPLARALARSGPALILNAGRHLPRVSSGAPLVLAGRIAARGQRQETPLPRPAATLHRSPPAAAPAETAMSETSEASTRTHRASPGGFAAGAALPAGTPGLLSGTPGELDRLTEQVIRRIDRRMDVWRERTGRVS